MELRDTSCDAVDVSHLHRYAIVLHVALTYFRVEPLHEQHCPATLDAVNRVQAAAHAPVVVDPASLRP